MSSSSTAHHTDFISHFLSLSDSTQQHHNDPIPDDAPLLLYLQAFVQQGQILPLNTPLLREALVFPSHMPRGLTHLIATQSISQTKMDQDDRGNEESVIQCSLKLLHGLALAVSFLLSNHQDSLLTQQQLHLSSTRSLSHQSGILLLWCYCDLLYRMNTFFADHSQDHVLSNYWDSIRKECLDPLFHFQTHHWDKLLSFQSECSHQVDSPTAFKLSFHSISLVVQINNNDASLNSPTLPALTSWLPHFFSHAMSHFSDNQRYNSFYSFIRLVWKLYPAHKLVKTMLWNGIAQAAQDGEAPNAFSQPPGHDSLWKLVQDISQSKHESIKKRLQMVEEFVSIAVEPEPTSTQDSTLVSVESQQGTSAKQEISSTDAIQLLWECINMEQLLQFIMPPNEIEFIEEDPPKQILSIYHQFVFTFCSVLYHVLSHHASHATDKSSDSSPLLPNAEKLSMAKLLILFGIPLQPNARVERHIFTSSKIAARLREIYNMLVEKENFSISPLSRQIIEFLRPFFMLSRKDDEWKLNVWAYRSLHHCVSQTVHPYLSGKTLELLIPMTLKLVDDVSPDQKKAGLLILKHLTEQANRTHMRWYTQLLMIAMINCISHKNAELADDTLSCCVKLLRILVPTRDIPTSQYYNNVTEAILYSGDYSIEMKERIALVRHLRSLVSDMGISAARFLPSILRMILSEEFLLTCKSDTLFVECVECLICLCKTCWPRMKSTANSSQVLMQLEKSIFLKEHREECAQLIGLVRKLNGRVVSSFENNMGCFQKSFEELLRQEGQVRVD